MSDAIVTMMPYAPYLDEVLQHPIVSGIRLNTVMPVKDTLEGVVERLRDSSAKYDKELWIDLKCRQLRVKNYGVPPFTEIELTHSIDVNTPVTAYFSDGEESATVLEVQGNRLIMQDGPKRVVGPGESVNIPSSSLRVDGYLTDLDKKYIEAGTKHDFHNYMLSYVEQQPDIEAARIYDPKANIITKIESKKGLDYVQQNDVENIRLMAARGDLFLELNLPHHIIAAEEAILKKDNEAVVASRLFPSLAYQLEPRSEDIGDVDHLLRMGYKHFMLGDDVSLKRDSILSALNLLRGMAERYG